MVHLQGVYIMFAVTSFTIFSAAAKEFGVDMGDDQPYKTPMAADELASMLVQKYCTLETMTNEETTFK